MEFQTQAMEFQTQTKNFHSQFFKFQSDITNHVLDLRASIDRKLDHLTERIVAIETDDRIVRELEKLRQEYAMTTLALKRIEGYLQLPSDRQITLRGELDLINNRLSILEKRVDEIQSVGG
jgi:hypothetical protein